MNKIVPLWSVPRSISTGFERMMFERGDFKVIHEPYGYFFYLEAAHKDPVGMQPQEGHPQTFEGTTEMIEAAAAPTSRCSSRTWRTTSATSRTRTT